MSRSDHSHSLWRSSLSLVLATACWSGYLIYLADYLGTSFLWEFTGFVATILWVLFACFSLASMEFLSPLRFPAVTYGMIYFCFGMLSFLLGETIDQPHPHYLSDHWSSIAFRRSISVGCFHGILIGALISLDQLLQPKEEGLRDTVYCPRFMHLPELVKDPRARLVLLIGGSLLFGYYLAISVDVWWMKSRATVWPPKRVYAACIGMWCLLWFADCFTRPRITTAFVVFVYSLFIFIFQSPLWFGILRE
ncbi:MAG: hypothetical protein HUJ26_19950 [Planctomycetaceae bacterium]|nr:hypothetical protein [Planctomycetaceae bacterium]